MGGPISVAFSDKFMCKMEFYVVVTVKPIFHKCYVDDTYVQRKKNDADKLFEELNAYNKTLEANPTKFLNTELARENAEITTQVFNKLSKLSAHWIQKFLLDIGTMLSLEKCIKPKELHQILIMN